MSTLRYTVRKLGWYQPPHGDPYTRRIPTATPVASFDTFDEAEMHRRVLEAEAREGENPFRFGGASLFFQSSLDGPRLHDWLMDEAIDPPESELRHADWRAWWNAFAHTWSEHQLAHVWAAFDKVRFFDVVEAAPNTAHVVVEIVWGRLQRDWGPAAAGTEGGRLAGVYRRAKTAEAERARRNRSRNAGNDVQIPYSFRYNQRAGYDDGSRVWPMSRATFFEVAEVPTDVPPFAGAGFLVQRRAVADISTTGWREYPSRDARVPISLFADRADAVAMRDTMAAECQQTINPFVFLTRDPDVYLSRDRFAELGLSLPLPARNRRVEWLEWLEWYDLCQDDATDEQRAGVWELCDQPLFEVLRLEVGDE